MTETTPAPNEFKEWQSFHLGDILSIITGVMVSPEGIGGVYKILGWMTGENLFTHQLLRASDECEPVLRDLYPGLANLETKSLVKNLSPDIKEEFWKKWLDVQVERFGETLPVPKLLVHESKDPLTELFEMRGGLTSAKSTIIVISPDEDLGAVKAYLENDGGFEAQNYKVAKEVDDEKTVQKEN